MSRPTVGKGSNKRGIDVNEENGDGKIDVGTDATSPIQLLVTGAKRVRAMSTRRTATVKTMLTLPVLVQLSVKLAASVEAMSTRRLATTKMMLMLPVLFSDPGEGSNKCDSEAKQGSVDDKMMLIQIYSVQH